MNKTKLLMNAVLAAMTARRAALITYAVTTFVRIVYKVCHGKTQFYIFRDCSSLFSMKKRPDIALEGTSTSYYSYHVMMMFFLFHPAFSFFLLFFFFGQKI
ncbi:uncharacterized protein LOC111300753 [Durio zibethinus]|uniref:Uncharacterized protein LOC111300753 n=1 Tax=Durio zibethinus TaxID=66656 RepID=A0A6P5ZI22_DURZI|nr:uncharacterized protein LOC111300753 [Durio zibethinus]